MQDEIKAKSAKLAERTAKQKEQKERIKKLHKEPAVEEEPMYEEQSLKTNSKGAGGFGGLFKKRKMDPLFDDE